MIPRRRVVKSVCTLALGVSLSGCSGLLGENEDQVQDSDGDGVIDSEDYAPRDPSVQSQNDVAQGSGETNSQEAENTPESQNTPNQSRQIKQNLLDEYDAGSERHNEGMNSFNSGVRAFNNRNLSTAESDFRSALSSFDEALNRWEQAYDTSLKLDNSEAQTICDDALTYMQRMKASAQAGLEGVMDGQQGNRDAANEHFDEHTRLARRAEEIPVRPTTTLQDVLGL